MIKKTYKTNLILSYIIVIVLVTTIMSGLHFYQIYYYTVLQNINEIENISKQSQTDVNFMLEQLDVMQYQAIELLISEPEYENNQLNSKEYLQLLKKIEPELQALRRSYPFVKDIYWLDRTGNLFSTNSAVIKAEFVNNTGLKTLVDNGEDNALVTTYKEKYLLNTEKSEYIFSYVKNLYDLHNVRERKGVLQINMKYYALSKELDLINSLENCVAYIIDENNKIVWFPDMKYLNLDYRKVTYNDFKLGNMSSQYSRTYKLSHGWKVKVVFNNTTTNKNLMSNLESSLLLMFIMIVISIICAYKYSDFFTKPLKKLTNRMKLMESGELKEIHTISKFEEIKILEQVYNSMIHKLDEMTEKMAFAKTENINAKILALQTQINPHFLANCFELIRGKAIQDSNVDIEVIANSLVRMYRYISDDSNKKVTFGEELDYVKNYIRIQEFRFGTQIQIFYRVQKEALSCKILCLLLQPLVENAYQHGFDSNDGLNWIVIEAVIRDEFLEVYVKDNGLGIEKDQLQALKEKINNYSNFTKESQEGTAPKNMNNGKKIGLKNVNSRLFLYYGVESCLTITSEVNKGTCVSFKIDISKK